MNKNSCLKASRNESLMLEEHREAKHDFAITV